MFLCLALTVAASGPAQPARTPLDAELDRARAEQAAAEAEAGKLEQVASKARGQAERLRAEQAAAARAIEAAEARITAADMQVRLLSATLEQHRRRLARQQQPLAALLGGLAIMAQRPPLLAIADRGSIDEFVRVRVLLDATLPVIRRRTAGLSNDLDQAERLQQSSLEARAETVRSRQNLASRRDRFAALEREALGLAEHATGGALTAGDMALAAGEDFQRLRAGESGSRAAAEIASRLALDGPSPARPVAADTPTQPSPLRYVLPVVASVTDGVGAVSASGVRSRGITVATPRGGVVVAPADGVVRFSGPFRDYDGVLIIEHGGGWTSVLLNVGSEARVGARVRIGEPIGRALGPLGIELSQNGRRWSPALIAGSSRTLSNGRKGG
jgi:septal ring factor EnvC (AmiA/AmiB activator)